MASGATGDVAVGVVLASGGYPGSVKTGVADSWHRARRRAFPASTCFTPPRPAKATSSSTAGGRVLTVVGRAPTFERAIALAYEGVAQISFEGMHYRRDIGLKAKAAFADNT